MTDLGDLGGDRSRATSVNDRGQVVGESDTEVVTCELCGKGNFHAFLWDGGVMRDLGTLGGPTSTAVDINDLGQVLGLTYTASMEDRVVVWQDGAVVDLTSRGVDGYPVAINDCGDVVADGDSPARGSHAYLWRGVAAQSR